MSSTVHHLTDDEALEAAVGARPATHHLKSISDLDEHCEAILSASPVAAVASVAGDGSLHTRLVGGEPGVLGVAGPTRLAVPGTDGLDVPDATPAGILALVPGWRETLRINGRLRTGPDAHLEVEEAFLHCAKAVIRSKLWDEPDPPSPDDVVTSDEAAHRTDTPDGPTSSDGPTSLDDPAVATFLARSPFVLLSSVDDGGEADISPKGDPAGFVQVLDDRTVAIPDRPGNHRTDTLHNLMTRPDLGLMVLVPGDDRVVEIRGRAHVSDDPALLEPMEVNGKVPKAAVVVDVAHVEMRHEPALAAARPWDPSRHVDPGTLPKATQVWVDHVKRNKDPGLASRAARKLVNEKVLAKGIERDYRSNLY